MATIQNIAQIKPSFMRAKTVCQYLSIGRTKLHELATLDPTFPSKITLSPRCVGWTKAQIDAWLESKIN